METKTSPRKTVTTLVGSCLQALPEGYAAVPVMGSPYTFTLIDPEGRTFRVSIKESK